MRRNDFADWHTAVEQFSLCSLRVTGRFERWLARNLRTNPSGSFRQGCAYLARCCDSSRVTSALVAAAADQQEHFLIRGECLESLSGKANRRRPKTRMDQKVHRVVRSCLKDPHPNVRFWACYTTALLEMVSAKSALHELINDPGLSDIGWTVGYEAGEALKVIRGELGWECEPEQVENPYVGLL